MKFYLEYLGYKEWREVVIEDESKFEVRECDGRIEYWYDGKEVSQADTDDKYFFSRFPHTQYLTDKTRKELFKN